MPDSQIIAGFSAKFAASPVAASLIIIVAVIHFYLAFVEMCAWTTRGKRFLSAMDPGTFEPSEILARNMGFYNIFIAVGLLWSVTGNQDWHTQIAQFFLGFIALAGCLGAITADWKLALAQTLPALLAIGAMHLGW